MCNAAYHWDDPPSGVNCYNQDLHNVTTWYPAATVLYPFAWELEWNRGGSFSTWASENWYVPIAAVLLYLLFCWRGPACMAAREPLKLIRPAWIWWNLALSLFSFCGAARLLPHLVGMLLHEGLRETVCKHPGEGFGGSGPAGLWTMLFIFSKIPELGDTVFIVLLKKPLLFLQWYHHVTVLLYCWHAYATRAGAGIWFITMNYIVHAFMYLYFAVSIGLPQLRGVLSKIAPVITLMQISQMFVGVAVMWYVFKFRGDKLGCHVTEDNWLCGVLMYASYFCLFVYFAVDRYCPCFNGSSSKKKKTQ